MHGEPSVRLTAGSPSMPIELEGEAVPSRDLASDGRTGQVSRASATRLRPSGLRRGELSWPHHAATSCRLRTEATARQERWPYGSWVRLTGRLRPDALRGLDFAEPREVRPPKPIQREGEAVPSRDLVRHVRTELTAD